MPEFRTLRPGFLVSLKTTVSGNVEYDKRTIEAAHKTETGAEQERWETERTVKDPAEFERGKTARSKARTAVTRVCAYSDFGLLCPESAAAELEEGIAAARAIAAEFNAGARYSELRVYVIMGRIAADDVEAVRAINSEVRGLLETMAQGIKRLDVDAVRDAASRAKQLGTMLPADAQARVQIAIDAARSAARQMVKAGEQAAQAIDTRAVRAITEARLAFLDLEDNAAEIAAPSESGRALDLEPPAVELSASAAQPSFSFEL